MQKCDVNSVPMAWVRKAIVTGSRGTWLRDADVALAMGPDRTTAGLTAPREDGTATYVCFPPGTLGNGGTNLVFRVVAFNEKHRAVFLTLSLVTSCLQGQRTCIHSLADALSASLSILPADTNVHLALWPSKADPAKWVVSHVVGDSKSVRVPMPAGREVVVPPVSAQHVVRPLLVVRLTLQPILSIPDTMSAAHWRVAQEWMGVRQEDPWSRDQYAALRALAQVPLHNLPKERAAEGSTGQPLVLHLEGIASGPPTSLVSLKTALRAHRHGGGRGKRGVRFGVVERRDYIGDDEPAEVSRTLSEFIVPMDRFQHSKGDRFAALSARRPRRRAAPPPTWS